MVGEDGRLNWVAAGDPPPAVQAMQSLDAGGHWVIPGFISAHSHLWQQRLPAGWGADQPTGGWTDALYKPAAK